MDVVVSSRIQCRIDYRMDRIEKRNPHEHIPAMFLRGTFYGQIRYQLIPPEMRDLLPPEGTDHAGEPADLAYYVPADHFFGRGRDASPLQAKVREGHNRSITFYRFTPFKDEYGNDFYFADVKGAGGFVTHGKRHQGSELARRTVDGVMRYQGIYPQHRFENDDYFAELFAQHGIAGHRNAFAIKLTELPVYNPSTQKFELVPPEGIAWEQRSGRAIPVSVLPMSPTGDQKIKVDPDVGFPSPPVWVMREFSEENRLRDVTAENFPQMLARLKVRFPESKLDTADEYATWFAERLGRSVGIMHGLRCTHRFLTPHNILGDGLLTDLDSVQGPDQYNLADASTSVTYDTSATKQSENPSFAQYKTFGDRVWYDVVTAMASLYTMVMRRTNVLNVSVTHEQLCNRFLESYIANLPEGDREDAKHYLRFDYGAAEDQASITRLHIAAAVDMRLDGRKIIPQND